MNKVFKIIWSSAAGAWCVVGEQTKGRGKAKSQTSVARHAMVAVTMAMGLGSWNHAIDGIAGSNAGVNAANANALSTFGSGGGVVSSSFNGVALAGASDCGIIGNMNAAAVYGTGASFTGGFYGFGTQASAVSWSAAQNAGTGQAGGINNYAGAQTLGNVNVTAANIASAAANVSAFGMNSFATGCGSQANGLGATAIGWNASAPGAGGIAMGVNANAAAQGGIALGTQARAVAVDSLALGTLANSAATRAIAIGSQANAQYADSVALGANSTMGAAAPTGTGYITGTAAPAAEVSVGSSTNLRRITNVADGAAAQDVATISQLSTSNTSLSTSVASLSTSTSTGLSTATSGISSLSTGLSTTNSSVGSLSTSTSSGLSTATSSISSLSTGLKSKELRPDSEVAWYNLGLALSQLERTGEAELAYRQVLSIRPSFAEANINLANLLSRSRGSASL